MSAAEDAIGHKGADLIAPGNTPASFDAALAAGVHMIEFDVLPEDLDDPDASRSALAHDYTHDVARRAHARGGARPPRLRRRSPDIELDVDLKLPGYEEPRRARRCASTACSSARWSRRSTCAA